MVGVEYTCVLLLYAWVFVTSNMYTFTLAIFETVSRCNVCSNESVKNVYNRLIPLKKPEQQKHINQIL